jgi:hypothetical protein
MPAKLSKRVRQKKNGERIARWKKVKAKRLKRLERQFGLTRPNA